MKHEIIRAIGRLLLIVHLGAVIRCSRPTRRTAWLSATCRARWSNCQLRRHRQRVSSRKKDIQGDVVLIGSTDTLIQALIAGQVNVAIVDPSAAINAVERGAALKIIGGTVPVAAYTLVTCPKYKTIKELKGTTIGVVSLVSGSTIFLREMLKAKGLELNRDYTIIQNGPTGQRLASLKGCSTSATMLLGGDLPRSRELGFLEIARLSDYIPNLQFHSLIVDGRWAETNSQLTVRYLKAMVRSMQWAHANREQAAELVSKRTGHSA